MRTPAGQGRAAAATKMPGDNTPNVATAQAQPRPPSVPTFAELAPRLVALGYEPVPIRPGSKGPVGLEGWQDGHPPEHYLPRCGRWGTGILCRTTPAVDLDIRSRVLVRLMVELMDDLIGGAPVRFGHPPKALGPFHADRPFPKVTTRWFALPGEDWTAEGYRAQRCEVLGDGQQFVAYAIHPGTGRPYRWCRGDLFTQEQIDLPYLEAADARRLMAAADRVFVTFGCIALDRKPGGGWRLWEERREPEREPRVDTAAFAGITAGELARRVDRKAHRNGAQWRARCPAHRGESHTSLVLKEENGQLLWHCFAGCSQTDVANALREYA